MAKKTRPIRILTDGEFDKLCNKIRELFRKKHEFDLTYDQLCETIARAINDNRIFG